jgi:hypothetical protein
MTCQFGQFMDYITPVICSCDPSAGETTLTTGICAGLTNKISTIEGCVPAFKGERIQASFTSGSFNISSSFIKTGDQKEICL